MNKLYATTAVVTTLFLLATAYTVGFAKGMEHAEQVYWSTMERFNKANGK